MSIVIYTSKGAERVTITPSEQSMHHKELMQSDYISLQFNAPLINFAVGDYTIINGAKYVLLDVDKPTSNKSQYYAYTLRFDADWQLLGKRVFFYNRQSGSESKWSITAKASTFMQLIVDNANSVGIGTFTAEVDSELTNLQFIEFDGMSILDALTMIAEAYECDWWIESNVIHLGTCKIGTAVSLRVGEALTSINRTDASNDVVTRLYAFGSTRNLPTNYRKDTSSTIIDGVVQQRLRLPEGTNYIDIRPNLADNEIIEGVRIFENVYPRTNGVISAVTTKQYTTTTDNADGTTTTEEWSAYRFTDNNIKFSRDYQLSGQDLQVQFQSGSLAGMTFVVEFNPDGEDEASSKSQVWEIIRNDNYGINLPNDTIKPKVGDTYVLTGWDSTKISSLGLVNAAEQELLSEANKWLQKNGNGVYNYECESNSIWCSGYRRTDGEFVFGASNVVDLEIGQAVALYDDLLIGTSALKSRVRAYEKNLINPYICRYTIGETSNYSKTDSLQQQVDAINRSADPTLPTFGQGGGGNIRLIKRYDSTPESDSLAYSSLRTKSQYLDKTKEDTAAKRITFESGIKVKGDGVVTNTITADSGTIDNITSSDYNGEFTGFTLKDTEGGSYLEVDKLNVRKKAVFRELDIKKIDHIGGANVTSPASCKIASVTTDASAYKCYFLATDGDKVIRNEWKVGDQALCHAFNLTTPRYYWRLVTAVSVEPIDGFHCVVLSMSDCDTDSDVPMAEDTIVCFGNRTNKDRQGAIILDSEGPSAPYLRQLKGINSYNISDDNIVTQLSPTKNIIRGEQIELITSSGNKGLLDIANETLSSAKGYADTTSSSALASAKTYADGVGTNATSTAKSYADGLFSDAEKYTQEREAYLQTQITANDNEIALRATKVEVQTVSDNVGALATRVAGAEASIKTNADNIALKAAKTEVDTIKTDLGNVTSRVSTAEAAIQVNADNISQRVTKTEYDSGITNANLLATAISKGVNLRTDCTFKNGNNKLWAFGASTITRMQIEGIPNDSGYGIEIKKTGADSKYGFAITQKPKANKIYVVRFVAKVPSGKTIYFLDYNYNGTNAVRKWLSSDKGTGDWQEYVYYIKTDSTGSFVEHGFFYISDTTTEPPIWYLAYFAIYDATAFENYTTLTEFNTEINQLSDQINLRATKTEVQTVRNKVGAVENRLTAAESSLTVQSNRISSVVSEQESMIKEYGFSDFVQQELTWHSTSQGGILGKMNAQADNYHYLKLTNVKAGDVVRFELNDEIQGALVYSLFGCDGDGQGAWEASGHSTAADEWLGFILLEISHDNDVVSESVINVDCPELYIYLSDDFANKSNIKVYLIRAKMTAQSRIDQSADNIRLQVGEAGINLNSKVITLDASKTIVTGDLAVRTVKTYWDAAQTQLKSAYNGNGEGTIVYYYPNGQVMKEDTFVTDSKGNVQGMRTTYYKADGSVAWTINEGGFMTTLPDYWTVLNNGNDLRYTTDEATMMEMLKQHLDDAMRFFSAAKFSRFVSQSGNYKNYNGKVSKAVRSSEAPTTSMLWSGVLVYSVELYEDGWNPTYRVTYEVCTTRLGQIGLIATKKFNSLGEVK